MDHIDNFLCNSKQERKQETVTYSFLELMAIQSLKAHGETKDAEIQRAEESGGCDPPGETTQPNAT